MDISRLNINCNDTNYSLHNNLLSSVSTPRQVNQVPSVLTKEITPNTPCANQKSSGRCWGYAGLNLFRIYLGRKHGLRNFEFSQTDACALCEHEKASFT